MSNYTPVEGQKGLYRDNDTAAIINRDKNAYKSYMSRKKALDSKDNELNKMKEDLDNVKDELGEIKGLLSLLFKN